MMEKSTSVLCKEIRDSSEQGAGLVGKLQKIRVDSDWGMILGGWSDWSDKKVNPALREWQSTLRELGGYFMAIRDHHFANIAQADLNPESLHDLSEAIDNAISGLQVTQNQLSAKKQLYTTSEITQLSKKLRRYSDKIHVDLMQFIDDLHDQAGTRPVSRQDSVTSIPPTSRPLDDPKERKRSSRLRIPSRKAKVDEFRNDSRAEEERQSLRDGKARAEQTATPSSFDSSASSQKNRTGSEGTGRDTPSAGADGARDPSYIEPKSMSISGPVQRVPKAESIADESSHAKFRKASLPTEMPSISEPQDYDNYLGRSVLKDATSSSSHTVKYRRKVKKGKSIVPPLPPHTQHTPAKTHSDDNDSLESLLSKGNGKQKVRKASTDDAEHDDRPVQGESADWSLSSSKHNSILTRRSQHEAQFPTSPKSERSKSVANWIEQTTAPGPTAPVPPPTAPLPAIPGHVEALPEEDAATSDGFLSRPPSFKPIELDLPDLSFAEFTIEYTQASVVNSFSENHNVNTSSSQALPIQTGDTGLPIDKTQLASPFTTLSDPSLTFPHTIYPEGHIPPYTHIRYLGHGSVGTVDEVSLSLHHPNHPDNSTITPTFARKCARLSPSTSKHLLTIIEQEKDALRALSHAHIVKLVGTYEYVKLTGTYEYAMLMSPAGDRNLREFLEEFPSPTDPFFALKSSWIKRWFSCLASVLSYIHAKGTRHEDIKPSNIIHRGPDIYLTDFSSCTSFDSGMTTSTDTPAERITRIYSAPEALMKGKHGIGADVFSLGCVFAEMATVAILGRRVLAFWEYVGIERVGPAWDRENRYYYRGLGKVHEWFGSDPKGSTRPPRRRDDGSGSFYEECIKSMLAAERKQRPKAGVVAMRMRDWFSKEDLGEPCLCETQEEEARRQSRPGVSAFSPFTTAQGG